jgi:hypothetical protein
VVAVVYVAVALCVQTFRVVRRFIADDRRATREALRRLWGIDRDSIDQGVEDRGYHARRLARSAKVGGRV